MCRTLLWGNYLFYLRSIKSTYQLLLLWMAWRKPTQYCFHKRFPSFSWQCDHDHNVTLFLVYQKTYDANHYSWLCLYGRIYFQKVTRQNRLPFSPTVQWVGIRYVLEAIVSVWPTSALNRTYKEQYQTPFLLAFIYVYVYISTQR